jgi:HSP20 family molecular chaperone IbpA
MTYIQTQYDPFTSVGFDRIFNRMAAIQNTAQKATPYPPYNITKESDTTYIVEMAVAGISQSLLVSLVRTHGGDNFNSLNALRYG